MAPRFTVIVNTGTVTMSFRSVKPQTRRSSSITWRNSSAVCRSWSRMSERSGMEGVEQARQLAERANHRDASRHPWRYVAGAAQQHRPEAGGERTADVGGEAVAHHERLLGTDAGQPQGLLE